MTTQRKQVGAGWLKTSNDGRKKFISIVINGGLAPDINLVMFTNSYKEKENQPDYIIYLTQPREASPSAKPVNQNEFPAPDSPDSGGAEC